MKTERRLGIADAINRLSLSRARVKQLAEQGRIGEKIAGRYLFSEAELSRFAKIARPSGRPKSNSGNALRKSAKNS